MKTSYFARIPKLKAAGFNNLVAISNVFPKWLNRNEIAHMPLLSPGIQVVSLFKHGKISQEDFEKVYRAHLNSLNLDNWVREIPKDTVFLCYEKSDDFCHRHLLANVLRSQYGVDIDEFQP